MTPESEDLPANVDGRIFLRTMGRCDGKGLKYSVVSICAVPGNGVFLCAKVFVATEAAMDRRKDGMDGRKTVSKSAGSIGFAQGCRGSRFQCAGTG